MKNTRKRKGTTGFTRLSKARLDELVEEAIGHRPVHDDRGTSCGSFETTVLGFPVTVERVQLTLREEIVAAYRYWSRGG
jgi:hypothetical protein